MPQENRQPTATADPPLGDDLADLRRFVERGDGAAFRAVVERRAGAVFAVALRRTGNHHLAQEVTQSVFAALAKRAGGLREGTVVVAWLHRVATTESAEALRREYRQRRTKAAMSDQIAQRPGDQLPVEPAVYAELDEAIQALPEADREALLLRYAAGHGFDGVGEALGKSPEAARKQVSRAVDRLSDLLGKKGVAVGAAALASVLGGAFPASAPAGVVAAASALAPAASAGAGGTAVATPAAGHGTVSTLGIMAQLKSKIGIGAAALLLAVGGGSFLAGRHGAAGFHGSLTESQQALPESRPVVAVEVPPDPGEGGGGAVPGRPGDRGDGSDEATRILREAAALLRDRDHNAIAYHEAKLLLDRLGADDVPGALEFLEGIPDGDGLADVMAPLLVGVWARGDGAAAMAYTEERLEGGRAFSGACRAALAGWSRQDPAAAWAWFEARSGSGDLGMNITTFRWMADPVFRGWVETDPAAAVGAFAKLGPEDERAAALGISRAHLASLDPTPIRDAVGAMPASSAKAALVEELATRWATEEPEAAAAWLDSVPGLDARQLLKAKSEVAEEWVRRDRSQLLNVGAWVLTGAPEELTGDLVDAIGRKLAEEPE